MSVAPAHDRSALSRFLAALRALAARLRRHVDARLRGAWVARKRARKALRPSGGYRPIEKYEELRCKNCHIEADRLGFLVDGEWRRGGPGTFFSAPRGVEHGFRNPGPGRIRVLNIHAHNTGFVERMGR